MQQPRIDESTQARVRPQQAQQMQTPAQSIASEAVKNSRLGKGLGALVSSTEKESSNSRPLVPSDMQQQQDRQQQQEQPGGASFDAEPQTIMEFARQHFYSRNREARDRNKDLRKQARDERENNPDFDEDEFWAEHPLDDEAFQNADRPKANHYRTNEEYEKMRAAGELQRSGIDALFSSQERRQLEWAAENGRPREPGIDYKENYKQDRLEDQTIWDMKLGFFNVEGQKLKKDKDGHVIGISWSRRVEDAMNTIMEDVDGSGIEGQKTVFRMVRLYATMTIDRQGKMFNEDNDSWELTEDEFILICRCMHRSILLFGHPFVSPAFLTGSKYNRASLRGTDMFPSGYIPDVVAKAITGPNSSIRHADGSPMTAEELQDAAWQEWVKRTQPIMNATLANKPAYRPKAKRKKGEEEDDGPRERNLMAQRIAVESGMRAFAKVDGMSAGDFGDRFNIDTAMHYRLDEYRDCLSQYATVMNNKYDAAAVKVRLDKKLMKYESENRKRRSKGMNEFEASMNILSSGIKTNALWWNLPIRMSAIAEKGAGNLQTQLTLSALKGMYSNPERFVAPDEVVEAFRTREGHDAIDAAYLLLEIGGPGALALFARTGAPMTASEAIKYLQENVLKQANSMTTAQIQAANIKLNKFSQKILAGDHAFKKWDATLFFDALMISNQAIADTQDKLAASGRLDNYAGMAITGSEMLDIFKANNGDLSRFLSEIMTTSSGRDALIMMKGNNIAQFNAVGYKVNSMLRDHGIGNAAITAFLESFATYSVNFLYMMLPGAKTFTYLSMKKREQNGDINAADFAIGGAFGPKTMRTSNPIDYFVDRKEMPGFINGLKMNLMFDGITTGKWLLCAILIGGTIAALGIEPPDDPEDTLNISKYKIGSNLGLGPDTDGDGRSDGVEISTAYWINDLTQWGLPLAYVFALVIALPSEGINGLSKGEILSGIFLDSVYGQFDGNVVLDVLDGILGFHEDVADIQRAAEDPNYEMTPSPFFALAELGLRAFGKIAPGAPLYKAWGKSAFLRGPYADMYSTNKVFDKSSEWAAEVGKTDYIDDPVERLVRKYSAGNWMLAVMMDGLNAMSPDSDQRTGYLWWEMPTRTKTEPYALALHEQYIMDYDHLDEGETVESYNAKRTDELIQIINDRGYESPEEAIRDGFFIEHDIRYAALDTMFSELNMMENDFEARKRAKFPTEDDYRAYKEEYDRRKSEIWDFINGWLKNDDIPEWPENYEQYISDWDVTYVRADGSPATFVDYYRDLVLTGGENVKKEWKLKGNHPTAMTPWTTVDYSSNDMVQRGWSGETKPAWLNEDSNLTSMANIRELGDEIITVGRDAGSTVNDVYYGEEYNGQRLHPDDITIGERSWHPKDAELSADIANFGPEDASGGVYGDKGRANGSNGNGDEGNGGAGGNASNGSPASANLSDDGDGGYPWLEWGELPWEDNDDDWPGYYPRSTYSYSGRRGGGGGSSYSPRIYSNTPSLNAGRAATMYTKIPYSARATYLNPGFETKGSREAYKRQDI